MEVNFGDFGAVLWVTSFFGLVCKQKALVHKNQCVGPGGGLAFCPGRRRRRSLLLVGGGKWSELADVLSSLKTIKAKEQEA